MSTTALRNWPNAHNWNFSNNRAKTTSIIAFWELMPHWNHLSLCQVSKDFSSTLCYAPEVFGIPVRRCGPWSRRTRPWRPSGSWYQHPHHQPAACLERLHQTPQEAGGRRHSKEDQAAGRVDKHPGFHGVIQEEVSEQVKAGQWYSAKIPRPAAW